jgi:hypothetical protein
MPTLCLPDRLQMHTDRRPAAAPSTRCRRHAPRDVPWLLHLRKDPIRDDRGPVSSPLARWRPSLGPGGPWGSPTRPWGPAGRPSPLRRGVAQ